MPSERTAAATTLLICRVYGGGVWDQGGGGREPVTGVECGGIRGEGGQKLSSFDAVTFRKNGNKKHTKT